MLYCNADVTSGNVNAWKRDGNQHFEDGAQPQAEKWQGDHPQQYMNSNIPPQQFEAWHGHPMNAPPGAVWYRGPPPGGPPYPPVAPGSFPMEPYPYYRPQYPAPPPIVNSQPVPLPGGGPRGHHHRPHVPDAYIHPGMPIRPGFYPGPVPYEGYYGPPMGYCNSNDMGMSAAPPVHGRYSTQNTPEAGSNHARAGGRGPTVQVDSGHSEENRGPYKVLMKQHNEWGGKEEEDNWERSTVGNNKNEWGADNRRDEEMFSRTTPGENFGRGGSYSSDNFIVKSPEGMDKAKAVDDSGGRKSESSPEVPCPATRKDPTLLQKIEGLNAKARATDGWHDAALGSSREEQKNRLQAVNAKADCSKNEVATLAACFERTQTTGDKIIQSTAASAVAIPRFLISIHMLMSFFFFEKLNSLLLKYSFAIYTGDLIMLHKVELMIVVKEGSAIRMLMHGKRNTKLPSCPGQFQLQMLGMVPVFVRRITMPLWRQTRSLRLIFPGRMRKKCLIQVIVRHR